MRLSSTNEAAVAALAAPDGGRGLPSTPRSPRVAFVVVGPCGSRSSLVGRRHHPGLFLRWSWLLSARTGTLRTLQRCLAAVAGRANQRFFFFSPCVFNFCAKGYPPSPTPHGHSLPHDLLRFVLLLLFFPPRSLPSSFVAGVVAAALALFLYMQVHRTARVLHVLACPAPS